MVLAALTVSCLTTAVSPQPQFYGSDLAASHEESEVVLNSQPDANGFLSIYVDGILKQTMTPKDTVKLIIPNGQHALSVDWTIKDDDGFFLDTGKSATIKSDPLSIDVASMQYVYNITLPAMASAMMVVGKKVTLTLVSSTQLSGRLATGNSTGVQGAAIRAARQLMARFPRNATVAVLSISSKDDETSEIVIDELEFQLINSSFKTVNRTQLNTVRSEHALQLSGEVSDASMVSIGKLLAARIIITGSITGSSSTRTLTLKALDVETGEYSSIAREAF
jgi:hypothetical protein